jgi:hypothetical protein
MKKNIHVTHRANGDWAVIGEKDSRASSLHQTQSSAIATARPIAENNRAELVIHGRNNQIVDKDSYGRDPNPPRDKKH